MSGFHTHQHDPNPGRLAQAACAVLLVSIVIGVVALWPQSSPASVSSTGPRQFATADVVLVGTGACPGESPGVSTGCRVVEAVITSGSDRGAAATFELLDIDYTAPSLLPGDSVVLQRTTSVDLAARWVYQDLRRDAPLAMLVAVFAVAVVALGRWQGARSLVALAAATAIVVGFVIPAVLAGSDPMLVALVGAGAVAAATIFLGHGRRVIGVVSFLAISASLVVVAVTGWFSLWFADITGLADPAMQTLRVTATSIEPRGILLAGLVIAALGVLDDVVVTQVSAVVELAAGGQRSRSEIVRSAMRIGRDHIGATVNTLFLAYIGTSVAALLVFSQAGGSWGYLVTSELVAAEVVRALAGGIGLIAAVPVATWLAAILVTGSPHPPRVVA